MVTHNIADIREFYNGDTRFLDQFPHFENQGMKAFLEGRGVDEPKSKNEEVAKEGGGEKKEKVRLDKGRSDR